MRPGFKRWPLAMAGRKKQESCSGNPRIVLIFLGWFLVTWFPHPKIKYPQNIGRPLHLAAPTWRTEGADSLAFQPRHIALVPRSKLKKRHVKPFGEVCEDVPCHLGQSFVFTKKMETGKWSCEFFGLPRICIETSFEVLPSAFHDQPAEPGDGM